MRKRKSLLRKVVSLIIKLAVLAVLLFGAGLAALSYAESNVPQGDGTNTTAMIVLGAQVLPNGQPNVQLEWRLQAALEAYQAHQQLIITCGAQGSDEPAPEGEVMRNWLIERGVAEADVIAETASYNTQQNIENAKALLPEGTVNVLIITSDYHLPRAMAVARDLGFNPSGIGSDCTPEYWMKNHSRELLAWGKYYLNKIIPTNE